MTISGESERTLLFDKLKRLSQEERIAFLTRRYFGALEVHQRVRFDLGLSGEARSPAPLPPLRERKT
jgi:hypothetical protein